LSCSSKDHSKHMCALKLQGLGECIESLSNKPIVECKNCGAKANSIKNICLARLTESEPEEDIVTKEVSGDGFCGAY